MTLTVGCIGAGYFAAFHHDAWNRHPDIELVGVADRDLDRAERTGFRAFASLHEMLADGCPDILDLVVPPQAHAQMIKDAIAAAPKAIICQKPFGASLEEAEELTRLAKDAGIPLIIHENFRFQPWNRRAKAALEAGLIGTVHQVTFRCRTGDGQGPHAYLDRQPYFQTMPRLFIHETGVHWVDTFRYLLGPITGVFADLRKLNPAIAGEDAGYVIFEFADGVRALLDGNRHLDHAAENTRMTLGECQIEGTDGTLTLDGYGGLWHRKFGDAEATSVLDVQEWPGFAGDCVYALQAHVVEALQGKGDFENTAEDYLTVRAIEEAIYTSARERRFVKVVE